MSYRLVVVAIKRVCDAAGVVTTVGTAVGVVTGVVGVWLVQPEKQVATNSSKNTAAINVTCVFFFIN